MRVQSTVAVGIAMQQTEEALRWHGSRDLQVKRLVRRGEHGRVAGLQRMRLREQDVLRIPLEVAHRAWRIRRHRMMGVDAVAVC